MSNNQSEFQFDGVMDNLILQDVIIETAEGIKWSDFDIRILKEFCKRHKIPRFHCGHMSPTAALAYLKNQMGVSDGPMENNNPYSPNNPYPNFSNKKNVLHG